MEEIIRLTKMTKGAGWASKIGPGVLQEVLKGLPRLTDADLLVGFDTNDDACVYKLSEDIAVIQTVDFFPPIVDDPYLYGQIAAANALSDIYAMGGLPKLALNLLCFPNCLPLDMVRSILEGGYSKVAEAGALIAGGHSIEDPEPKYGLCVSGFIHPNEIWTNASAQEGDLLILTKPLGSGIINTAAKADLITMEQFEPCLTVMASLNKYARNAAKEVGLNACTDITGFGLIGHACEMASGSKKTIELYADALPLLPQAEELAQMGIIPGGAYRNMEHVQPSVRIAERVPQHLRDLLADPQTSGGLLLSVPENRAQELLRRLEENTPHARIVGQVLAKSDVVVQIR